MAMDVLVSARVTQGKKEAAKDVLASLGATTSDLINCAFDYVLETQQLPTATEQPKPSMVDFLRFQEASSLPINWGPEAAEGDYRSILRKGKRAAYDSLA